MSESSTQADVAIVGAGPVGCALAALLGRRGLSVVIVEREHGVFPHPRAAHIDHTGLRALQEIGCLNELLPNMLANPGLDFLNASDVLLMRVPAAQGSVSGLPASMYFHQPLFDETLRTRVASHPHVELMLSTEATGLVASDASVRLEAQRADGRRIEIEAQWLIGCDGASGPVREWIGVGLEDLRFQERWLVVNLLLEAGRGSLPESAIGACDPNRPLYSIPMPHPRHRFEFMLFDHEDPDEMQTDERVLDLLDGWLEPHEITIERSAVYELRGLVADPWQVGRVLLAGDAAHQMPPFLGQGMCSGIRDAVNLAWKLDHVIRRGAPARLLETYYAERGPHVRHVATAAIDYGRLVCTIDEQQAAERDQRFLEDPRPPAERITFRLPGLEPGPLVLAGGGGLFVQPALDPDGRGLDDVIGQRIFVLGREATALAGAGQWWADRGAFVATLDDLPDFAAVLDRWMSKRECTVVVVRPDRHVLGAGTDLDELTREVAALLADPLLDARPAAV